MTAQGLLDAHCHLDPAAGSAVPARDGDPRTGSRILCAVGPEDWPAVSGLVAAWPGTTPAFGLHPWHIASAALSENWPDALTERLRDNPDAWLGEAGLDSRRQGIAPAEIQEAVFRDQLRTAARLGRKANLHCVGAWEAFLPCLDEAFLSLAPGLPFIVHGFGGPYQFVDLLSGRGAYFTVGPLQAKQNSRKMRERAALFPGDRILLESDAFLQPGRDAPDVLEETLVWLGRARNIPAPELAVQIRRNGARLLQGDSA